MSTATLTPPPQADSKTASSPDAFETESEAPPLRRGRPVWRLAQTFPEQGDWNDADYLALDVKGERIELVDGCLEFLTMPIRRHESLAIKLFKKLDQLLGEDNVYPSGYKLQIRNRVPRQRNDYRLPDVIASIGGEGFGPRFASAATLVVEVMSHEAADHERDLVEKRRDYAEAGVPEYWVVDPEARTVLLLRLDGEAYAEVGTFGPGQTVVSEAVEGFEVDVTELFDTPAAS